MEIVILYNYQILGGVDLNETKIACISDELFFELMMATVFGSGIKSSIIEKKWECIQSHFTDFRAVADYDEQKLKEILNDPNMLHNPYKINAIVFNAIHMTKVIKKFGSMDEFIKSYQLPDCEYDILGMVNDLCSRFKYFGEVTSLRFIDSVFGVFKKEISAS